MKDTRKAVWGHMKMATMGENSLIVMIRTAEVAHIRQATPGPCDRPHTEKDGMTLLSCAFLFYLPWPSADG